MIVVTDRRVLDKQLQGAVDQFEQTLGVVVNIDKNSSQLAEALTLGRHIVVTTLQTFPFILDQVSGLGDRTFAVIIDEAHSSQTGEAAHKMRLILSDGVNAELALESSG